MLFKVKSNKTVSHARTEAIPLHSRNRRSRLSVWNDHHALTRQVKKGDAQHVRGKENNHREDGNEVHSDSVSGCERIRRHVYDCV